MNGRRRTVGLLGFGAFGRFMARHLAPHFDLLAHDRALPPNEPGGAGGDGGEVPLVELAEAARADIVVLAVTLDGLADVARTAARHVRPGALVLDVASVKLRPAEIMREFFPPDSGVDLLGLHPMFGPQSGAAGIRGLPCAVCPMRVGGERLRRTRDFLAGVLGLRLIDTDPDGHDREMARVQALTHFISRGLRGLGLGPSELSTRAYEKLEEFANILLSDSWELFLTIERGNPYAAPVRRKFLAELAELERRLEDGDSES